MKTEIEFLVQRPANLSIKIKCSVNTSRRRWCDWLHFAVQRNHSDIRIMLYAVRFSRCYETISNGIWILYPVAKSGVFMQSGDCRGSHSPPDSPPPGEKSWLLSLHSQSVNFGRLKTPFPFPVVWNGGLSPRVVSPDVSGFTQISALVLVTTGAKVVNPKPPSLRHWLDYECDIDNNILSCLKLRV